MTIANSVTTVRSSTITSNIAGNTVSLAGYGGTSTGKLRYPVENSIVAGGTAAPGLAWRRTANESVDFSGRNIVSDTTCGAANASRSISDPLLGPLVTTSGRITGCPPDVTGTRCGRGCTLAADQREQVRPIRIGM